MYCQDVITVKTEYSIRKFVSAKRSMPKTYCSLEFIRGCELIVGSKCVVLDLKICSLLVRRLSFAQVIFTQRRQMCEKRLVKKAKFAYGWKSDILMYVNVRRGGSLVAWRRYQQN